MSLYNVISNKTYYVIVLAKEGLPDMAFSKGWRIISQQHSDKAPDYMKRQVQINQQEYNEMLYSNEDVKKDFFVKIERVKPVIPIY